MHDPESEREDHVEEVLAWPEIEELFEVDEEFLILAEQHENTSPVELLALANTAQNPTQQQYFRILYLGSQGLEDYRNLFSKHDASSADEIL